ncbi:MAG: CDP-alcohol phosphatidyltransferase family protein [Candidatus Binatia bacterium]|nr:CDP-alcohol phosphatidyltransferase family protein [Candidatus Binatia bacterium]
MVRCETHKTLNLAHVLTSTRLLLTPVFLCAVEMSAQRPTGWRVASVVALFLAICATDYYDGPIARARGLASDRGKVFDNLADIVFLLLSLGYLVYGGVAPWWIPTAIAIAFAQYTLDSWVLSRAGGTLTLVSNPVGHWAGILNFLFTGVLALHAALQQQLLPPLLCRSLLAFWLAYLLVAMAVRLRFFLTHWRAARAWLPVRAPGGCPRS